MTSKSTTELQRLDESYLRRAGILQGAKSHMFAPAVFNKVGGLQERQESYEHCLKCDALTGRAGKGDDSIYIDDKGPYCQECADEIEDLKTAKKDLHESVAKSKLLN